MPSQMYWDANLIFSQDEAAARYCCYMSYNLHTHFTGARILIILQLSYKSQLSALIGRMVILSVFRCINHRQRLAITPKSAEMGPLSLCKHFGMLSGCKWSTKFTQSGSQPFRAKSSCRVTAAIFLMHISVESRDVVPIYWAVLSRQGLVMLHSHFDVTSWSLSLWKQHHLYVTEENTALLLNSFLVGWRLASDRSACQNATAGNFQHATVADMDVSLLLR